MLDIARHGPAFLATPNHPHYCTDLHLGDGILAHARELHLEYCDHWPD
ncbi:hypothetical protein VSH64_12700 [Amycolatopsis rhabdoformis]|uniref:Uncharacterized protein n=1 Tax=Amycolatopsis rhabdoformis TaxID=1448059 RepID=A0ABZ1IFS2_9PSEU|nr:hypothetical protein [Amycolatopsis rhabdoformis]WSE32964.1 hypothetical protein VSH64_12700 [Amycolatopsis rhabdoformis]